MPYHVCVVYIVFYQGSRRCASYLSYMVLRKEEETNINSHRPVLVEDSIKCPERALTIGERDSKYIFNRIPFVQSQAIIFQETLLVSSFTTPTPYILPAFYVG